MKRFHSEFSARSILLPYFLVLVLFVVCMSIFGGGMAAVGDMDWDPEMSPGPGLGLMGLGFAAYLVAILALVYLDILIMVVLIRSVRLEDELLTYEPSPWALFWKTVGWTLLSVITLGIFIPWFYQKFIAYVGRNTRFKDKEFEFQGRGLKLLGYFLLAFVLPMAVIMILFAGAFEPGRGMGFTGVLLEILTMLVMLPFVAIFVRWCLDFTWNGKKIRITAGLWEIAAQLFVQYFLTVITFGIYFPAAYIKLFRYFAEKTEVIGESGANEGSFGFDAPTGAGFGFIWGQTLLCLVTIGIYGPWAIEKVYRWWVEHTILIDELGSSAEEE